VAWLSVRASEPALGDTRYQLLRCLACGTARTSAGALPGLHDSGAYQPRAPRLHRAARPVLAAFDQRRLRLLRALVPPPARLLDAGAGRGRFVAAAGAAGYDAFGIDPSGRAAGERSGGPLRRVTIAQAEIAPRSLDAVTLWHVLEHLEQPGEALSRIAGWLRPGGGLLVAVPNLESLQARVAGERWYHFDVPRHRVHFTPAGLHRLLTARGFEVLATHHVLLEHNPYGMWQSLVNPLTARPSYLYNLLKRNAPLRSIDLPVSLLALALAPAAAVAELIAGLTGRGGTIAVSARRRR